MKRLYIVRHARSSWSFRELADIDRPLNNSGIRDAHNMAQLLADKKISVEQIITSPALRAISTAFIFARKLDYSFQRILFNSSVYESTGDEIKKVIENFNENVESIMIFGHDPSLSNFVSSVTNEVVEKIPTTGIVIIEFKIDEWQKIKKAKGKLVGMLRPKKAT
jgi:phosphohistidine phosphatase